MRQIITIYRAILKLFPKSFRERHAEEITELFASRLAETKTGRTHQRIIAALLGIGDLIIELPGTYWRCRTTPSGLGSLTSRSEPGEFLVQDLRHSCRALFASPSFSLGIVLTLSLGIGANTAMFGLVDAAFARPFPLIRDQPTVVVLTNKGSQSFSHPDYRDLRDHNQAFSGLAAILRREMNFGTGTTADRVLGQLVSSDYFATLGVEPLVGREFRPEEGRDPGGHRVAVVSHPTWRDRLGSDPEVVGRKILLNEHSYTVVGVMPPGFRGLSLKTPPAVWVPDMMIGDFMPRMGVQTLDRRHWSLFQVVGRLQPDVDFREAASMLRAAAEALNEKDPGEARVLSLLPARLAGIEIEQRQSALQYVSVLWVIVGLVLVIACLNVANLLLARNRSRREALAIRVALGASRARLIRPLVLEAILLSMGGAAVGLVLVLWVTPLLKGLRLPGAIEADITLDHRVLLFTAAASLLTGLAVGLWPAVASSKVISVPFSKGVFGSGYRSLRFRGSLIAAQVAFSLVLLIAAGLLLRTLWNLQGLPIGFQPANVLLASIDLDLQGYDRGRGWRFFDDLLERVRSLPGVESAGLASDLPLGDPGSRMGLFIEGDTEGPHMDVSQTIAGPGYFSTLGIPVVRGRSFEGKDRRDAAGVVIVNEAMSHRFWPASDALGQRVSVSGPRGPFYKIVGIVKDHRHEGLRERPVPRLYWSLHQLYAMMSGSRKTLVVRTDHDPLSLVPQLRSETAAVDPGTPLFEIKTLSTQLAESMTQERQSSRLLTGFSVIALLLAAVGLFGLTSSLARIRRREFGVRVALGARPLEAVGLLVRQAMALSLVGIGIGVVGSIAIGSFLRSQLFQVSENDPTVMAAAAALLLMISLFAAFLPAWRASRRDPLEVLRYE